MLDSQEMEFMPTTKWHKVKPEKFVRVTDEQSFTTFDNNIGFHVGDSTKDFHGLTVESVRLHLEWARCSNRAPFVSVCGTAEKVSREIRWRERCGYDNITAWDIATDELEWRTLDLDGLGQINSLRSDKYSKPVMFVRAAELIEALGLKGNMDSVAEQAAKDEWLALFWIPWDMIIYAERY